MSSSAVAGRSERARGRQVAPTRGGSNWPSRERWALTRPRSGAAGSPRREQRSRAAPTPAPAARAPISTFLRLCRITDRTLRRESESNLNVAAGRRVRGFRLRSGFRLKDSGRELRRPVSSAWLTMAPTGDPNLMRILVVEDDPELAASIAQGLEEAGMAVDTVGDGNAGLAAAMTVTYDVVVLDGMLPERDGFQVSAALRDRRVQTPMLILTGRDSVDDRGTGLESGGGDCLAKTFAFRELVARGKAT